jgi:polysaccharide biosynthesis transport protein
MAISAVTPRDRLQRLVDLGRKTLRYWWLVAVFAVIGGGLSFAFAMFKERRYQSWSTVFYQERIQSTLLTPGREEIAQRNIAEKYGELLVARPQLAPILADPKTDPFTEESDPEIKLDKFRQAVKLEPRGGTSFRIMFTDADPERAKLVVEKLTKSLQEKDEQLRNDLARRTVEFVTTQKEAAQKDLRTHELALAEFLAKHPEFAQETQPGQSEGASIRAVRDAKIKAPSATGNPRLYALERQRQRIKARLDAPIDGPAVRIVVPPSAERIAAEAVVAEAQREVNGANRELENASSKFTELHPTVLTARDRVANAMTRLRQAQAAIPPDTDTIVAPASADDRVKLQKELARIDGQINELQRGAAGVAAGSGSASADSSTSWIVKLETEHADLRRRVKEQRERTNSLADSAFRAQIDASQKLAEAGGRLTIVDPAFKPVRPSGPGKTIFMIAGMVLFLGLGFALAVGFAVIDDRLYRRADLDQLDIAVLGVIPPALHKKHRKAA